MNDTPKPIAVYLTATGRSHVFVWPVDNDARTRRFVAGCEACTWLEKPDTRDNAEEAANAHAHGCHFLTREQWPALLKEGR